MELKAGYKQTDVGVIPNEWDSKVFGDVAQVIMGQSPVGYSYNNICEGVPLINGPTEFTNKHPIKIQWTTQPTKICRDGDLLLCVRGSSTGRMNISDDTYCIGRGVAAIRAKSGSDTRFLTYQLNSALQRLLSLSTGSTFPNIDKKSISSIRISLPHYPEQRAIAAALSDVDALIAALDRLIAKKRDIKQAAMQELLTGKRRLPGFSGEWKVVTFEQVATPRSDKVNPKDVGELPFCIELEHIEQGSGRLNGSSSVGERSSIKSAFHQGDVLFGKLRAYLRKYWLADRDGYCSTEIWPLMPNRQFITQGYLFQIVMSDQFLEAATIAYGTHMPRTDWNVVKGYQVNLPDLHEQEAISLVLSDIDSEIAALEARREKTRALKQGMMQELLTGRIRLVQGAEA
jgi:type I restriction enzyme, S subunit